MKCKELAKMIYFEVKSLLEEVENCEYQSDASDLRKHCLKIRYDLNILNKKLGKWNDETIF